MAHVLKDSMNHYAIEVKRGPKHVHCIVRMAGEVEYRSYPLTKMISDHEYHANDGTYQFDRRWLPCTPEQDAGCTLERVIESFLSGMLPVTDKARRMLEALRDNPAASEPPTDSTKPTEEGATTMSTKKAKTKKAPKAKKAKTAGEKKHARYLPEMKIKVLVGENPKRDGTQAHKMFALYEKCATVEDFIKKGGSRADLSWDSKHGFIKIS